MAKAKTTKAHNEKAKKGIKARVDALNALIENHKEEFEETHMRNRVKLGLPPKTAGPSEEEMEARVKRQREKLKKWEKELAMLKS